MWIAAGIAILELFLPKMGSVIRGCDGSYDVGLLPHIGRPRDRLRPHQDFSVSGVHLSKFHILKARSEAYNGGFGDQL